jgi:hypothetical protein
MRSFPSLIVNDQANIVRTSDSGESMSLREPIGTQIDSRLTEGSV